MPVNLRTPTGCPVPLDMNHKVCQQFVQQVIRDHEVSDFIDWCKSQSAFFLQRTRLRHAQSERNFEAADPKPNEKMPSIEQMVLNDMIDYSKALWVLGDTCRSMGLRVAARGSVSLGQAYGTTDWIAAVAPHVSVLSITYDQDTIDAVSYSRYSVLVYSDK